MDYNTYMNGVDKLDQNLAYYPVIRKTVKWTKKFVMYMLQVTIFNSYVIYKCIHKAEGLPPTLNLLGFHTSVVEALCKEPDPATTTDSEVTTVQDSQVLEEEEEEEETPAEEEETPAEGPPPRAPWRDPPYRLTKTLDHSLRPFPATPKKSNPCRRCRVCRYKDKVRKDTALYCVTCQVALHKACTEIYHSKKYNRYVVSGGGGGVTLH